MPCEDLIPWCVIHFIPGTICNVGVVAQFSTVYDSKFRLFGAVVLRGGLDHSRRCVDAEHKTRIGDEVSGEFPISAAHVKNPLSGFRIEIFQNRPGQYRDERS